MAVKDVAVRKENTIDSEHRHGCWKGVPTVRTAGTYITCWGHEVKHAMTNDCRQIDHAVLPGCAGCMVQKDHAYINEMRELL